jgi:peptidoglycan/LPS O-acetylase OafA/YrhL
MASPLGRKQEARSDALDVVRGLAIAMVIACHIFGAAWGIIGVDLFFVLSGFLICGSLIDNRDASNYFAIFYMRRAFRILPLYWIFLAYIATTSGLLLPGWIFLVFGQTFAWVHQGALTGHASITWSLAIEEHFYLLAPALIRFTPPAMLPKVLLGLALSTPLWRFGLALPLGDVYAAAPLLMGHFDALCGGALIAWALRQTNRGAARFEPFYAAVATSIAGLLAIMWSEGTDLNGMWMWIIGRSFIVTIFVGVVLIAATSGHRLPYIFRPLALAGMGSYAIYLWHGPVAFTVQSRALTLIGTALVAWVSWRLVERPCQRWAHQRWRYTSAGHLALQRASLPM